MIASLPMYQRPQLVDAHRRWLVAVLQPGIAGEALPDGVPLADRLDDARALLDGVGSIDAATSLRFLGDHVDDDLHRALGFMAEFAEALPLRTVRVVGASPKPPSSFSRADR